MSDTQPGSGSKRTTWRKWLVLTAAYAVVAFLGTLAVVAYLDSTTVVHPGNPTPTGGATATSAPTPTPTPVPNRLVGIPTDAEDIVFSFEGTYCSYRSNGSVTIKEVATDRLVQTLTESTPIVKSGFMKKRNIVLYFTLADNTLTARTLNLDSGLHATQYTGGFPSGSILRDVDSSSSVNLVFLHFERTVGSKRTDTLTYINVMKLIKPFYSGGAVEHMLLLNDAFSVYYEDSNHILHLGSGTLSAVGKSSLIGCDAADSVYVQALDATDTIRRISGSKVAESFSFDSTGFLRFYTDKDVVYAVYADHLVDLSGDRTTVIPYDSARGFLGLGGDLIFFRNATGDIVGEKRAK